MTTVVKTHTNYTIIVIIIVIIIMIILIVIIMIITIIKKAIPTPSPWNKHPYNTPGRCPNGNSQEIGA